MKISLKKSKKNALYAKKSFAQIKMRKINLKNTKMLEIIVITLENVEELLIVFAIKLQSTERDPCSLS